MISTYSANTILSSDKKAFSISPRLLELRKKIHDEEYLNNAVQRIALVMSRNLVESRKGF